MTKTPEPVAHGKMRPKPGSPPGLETDGKGNVIPLAERTKDDQEKAKAASSVKNPNGEAQNPSPMQRDQQGQGGKGVDRDPQGQQGGQH
jgi:hypothetical protein